MKIICSLKEWKILTELLEESCDIDTKLNINKFNATFKEKNYEDAEIYIEIDGELKD